MIIVETPIFTKLIKEMLSDDEYKGLHEVLITRPGSGDLIKESGGLRKIR